MCLKVFRRLSIGFNPTTEMRHGKKKNVFASNCQNIAIGFCVVNVRWWCHTQKHVELEWHKSIFDCSTNTHLRLLTPTKWQIYIFKKVFKHKYIKYMVNLRWKWVKNSKTFFIWPWTNVPIHKNGKICDTI